MPVTGSPFASLSLALLLLAGVAHARPVERLEAPGAELVRAHCTACHSLRLVTQNRGDADHWRRVIAWMQATQGLRQIPEPELDRLVAYLATRYPPQRPSRRAPLPPWQRPPGLEQDEVGQRDRQEGGNEPP